MEHCSVPIPQEVGMVQMTAAQVGHKIAVLNLEEAFQANGIITITPQHDTLNLVIARRNQSLPIYQLDIINLFQFISPIRTFISRYC